MFSPSGFCHNKNDGTVTTSEKLESLKTRRCIKAERKYVYVIYLFLYIFQLVWGDIDRKRNHHVYMIWKKMFCKFDCMYFNCRLRKQTFVLNLFDHIIMFFFKPVATDSNQRNLTKV